MVLYLPKKNSLQKNGIGLLFPTITNPIPFLITDCPHDAGHYVDQNGIKRCSYCDEPVNDHTLDRYFGFNNG